MEPTFNDYVALIYNRFEAFVQSSGEVAKLGVVLVTPALRWRTGQYDKAYRQFIKTQADVASRSHQTFQMSLFQHDIGKVIG